MRHVTRHVTVRRRGIVGVSMVAFVTNASPKNKAQEVINNMSATKQLVCLQPNPKGLINSHMIVSMT